VDGERWLYWRRALWIAARTALLTALLIAVAYLTHVAPRIGAAVGAEWRVAQVRIAAWWHSTN
jgi:hypothetical protein